MIRMIGVCRRHRRRRRHRRHLVGRVPRVDAAVARVVRAAGRRQVSDVQTDAAGCRGHCRCGSEYFN